MSMNRNLLKQKSVIIPFILAIAGFVFYFLLEGVVTDWFNPEIISLIKLLSIIVMFIGLCFTFFGFIKNMLQNIGSEIFVLHNRFDTISDIGKKLSVIKEKELGEIINSDKKELIDKYVDWIYKRSENAINLINTNVLTAHKPGYFDFTQMVYGMVESRGKIFSTSVVDPKWYDAELTKLYIEEQKKLITNKNMTFTRIFFINTDNSHSQHEASVRRNTFKAINALLADGFNIIVTKTTAINLENDIAKIDDSLIMEATVPRNNNRPLPEIGDTTCYIKEHDKFIEIDAYLNDILKRADNEIFEPHGTNNAKRLSNLERLSKIFLT